MTLANVVWPALYLAFSYWTWWVVAAGLLVELPVVVYAFGLPVRRSLIADAVMNAASACLGMLLLAIVGIAWEVFPGSVIHDLWDLGTFNPVTWSATFVLAVIINTAVEGAVLRYAFSARMSRGRIGLLAAANTLSVALAGLEMLWHTPRL